LNEAINVLEAKLDMKTLIIKNIREDNCKLESVIEEKDARILELEKEVNGLNASLMLSEVFVEMFKDRIDELDDVANGLREQNYEYFCKLDSKQQMIIDLEREVRDVRVSLSLLWEKVAVLEAKVASGTKKYEKIVAWVTEKSRQLASLAAYFGDLLIGMIMFTHFAIFRISGDCSSCDARIETLISQIDFQNVIIKKLESVITEKDRLIAIVQKETSQCSSFFRARFVEMTDYTDKLETQLELSREKEKLLTSELSIMNDNYSCLGNTVEKLGSDLMTMADDVSRLELDRNH